MKRTCGDCVVCCVLGAVRELDKPAHTACIYQNSSGCSIFTDSKRPAVCGSFQCSWLRGVGSEDSRPDKAGVMLSINNMNGGKWIYAIEHEKNAVKTKGKDIILELAKRFDFPVIIVNHDSKPPTDTGDATLVKDSLLARAQKMIGEKLYSLADGFNVYNLVKA